MGPPQTLEIQREGHLHHPFPVNLEDMSLRFKGITERNDFFFLNKTQQHHIFRAKIAVHI